MRTRPAPSLREFDQRRDCTGTVISIGSYHSPQAMRTHQYHRSSSPIGRIHPIQSAQQTRP